MEELLTRDGEPIAFWTKSTPGMLRKLPDGTPRFNKPQPEAVYVGSMRPGGVGTVWQKEGKVGTYII